MEGDCLHFHPVCRVERDVFAENKNRDGKLEITWRDGDVGQCVRPLLSKVFWRRTCKENVQGIHQILSKRFGSIYL